MKNLLGVCMLLAGNYLSLLTVTLINFETWGLVSSLKRIKKNLKNVENASKGVGKAFIQNLFLSNKKKNHFFLQGYHQQQSTRTGTTGTKFCKLGPADLKGGIRRT